MTFRDLYFCMWLPGTRKRVRPVHLSTIWRVAAATTICYSCAGAARAAPPEDPSEFRVELPARDHQSSGALDAAGYVGDGPRCTTEAFASGQGGAHVEIVKHSSNYSYAIHDFWGVLRGVTEEKAKRSNGNDNSSNGRAAMRIEFVDWTTADGTRRAIICNASIPGREREGGVVGWYFVDGEKVTTVTITYFKLRGLPRKVIDATLEKVGSSVVQDDARLQNWERKDIEKWIELLRTKFRNDGFLENAAGYLVRYDVVAFGLMGVFEKRGDADALVREVDAVIAKMQQWLREHAPTSGTGTSP